MSAGEQFPYRDREQASGGLDLSLRSVEPYPPNERPRPGQVTTSGGHRAPRVQNAIMETVREITLSS